MSVKQEFAEFQFSFCEAFLLKIKTTLFVLFILWQHIYIFHKNNKMQVIR